MLVALGGLCLCACGGVSAPQKGWNKYAGSTKAILEEGLTLKYVWIHDKKVSSGEAVYYKGNYGTWSDPSRTKSTTFYFTYDVVNDAIESSNEYIYTLALKLASTYSSSTGTLINNG